jgi:hypothetical protein
MAAVAETKMSFGIRIKWDYLGLNGIDFLDFWD